MVETFNTNPEINPTFLEDTLVVLKKDYTEAHDTPFTENELCTILKCGLSKYINHIFQGRVSTDLVDNTEYCSVEIDVRWEEGYTADGCVKAEDLQIYNYD